MMPLFFVSVRSLRTLFAAACLFLLAGATLVWAGAAPTTTTLAVTSGGTVVTTVSSRTAVTLTATVKAGSAPVTVGLVNFCDAAAAHCTDIHLLGTQQLTSNGTAVLKFVPGVGSHSYKAVFVGTQSVAASTSGSGALAVTGKSPSATAIAQSGTGPYTLTAAVTGNGGTAPTGTVSFIDTANDNAILGTASLGSGTEELSFVSSTIPTVWAETYVMVTADFNGDGIPDLAVASESKNNVTIMPGDGNGDFTPVSTYPATGDDPIAMVTGDFNGDGIADLAVLNQYAGDVTVLLGNGDGTFSLQGVTPNAGKYPENITVGDFNGDGILDLAVSGQGTGGIAILLGDGHGNFTPVATSPQTPKGEIVGTGDFNGDGNLDIIVVGYGELDILLGNGDGTFTAGATLTLSTNAEPTAFAVADFNGDGKLDLAVVNMPTHGLVPGWVDMWLGDGTGNFTEQASKPATGLQPIYAVVGDFNGDGIPDLAVVENHGIVEAGAVTILQGNGDGTFKTAAHPATDPFPFSAVAADFNGDGKTDLALTNVEMVSELLTQNQTATAVATGISPGGTAPQLVAANYTGDSNYDSSISATIELSSGLPTPTVSLTALPSTVTYGAPVTLKARVRGSGATPTGTVALLDGAMQVGTAALDTNGVGTFKTSSLLSGTHLMTANYSGNASYSPATSSAASVNVNGLSQTINFPAIANQAAATTVRFSATSSSGLTVSFASATPSICTVSGSTASLVAYGFCIVEASQYGNAKYSEATPVSRSFGVAHASQTLTFAAISSHQVAGTTVKLTGAASSGLPVIFVSLTPTICTVSGSSTLLIAAGSCTIQATQPGINAAGNSEYSPAPPISHQFGVAHASQTLTFAAISSQVAGTTLNLSASASSGLPVVFVSLSPTICTVSGATASLIAAGTCGIEATQPGLNSAGHSEYFAATPVDRLFGVAHGTQTITFGPIAGQVAGTTLNLTATASSGLPVSYTSLTPANCTISGATAALIAYGDCKIEAAQAGLNAAGKSEYFAATPVSQKFAVGHGTQIISFILSGNQVAGGTMSLTATASSGLPVSLASSTPSMCTISGSTISLLTYGVCYIQASVAGNDEYFAGHGTEGILVPHARQTITFPAIAGQVAGTPLNLTATASSGLAVSFASTTAGVCTVSGTTASFIAAGTCTIEASQAGNDIYLAAPIVSQSFAVTVP
jgi:hypothetical protein